MQKLKLFAQQLNTRSKWRIGIALFGIFLVLSLSFLQLSWNGCSWISFWKLPWVYLGLGSVLAFYSRHHWIYAWGAFLFKLMIVLFYLMTLVFLVAAGRFWLDYRQTAGDRDLIYAQKIALQASAFFLFGCLTWLGYLFYRPLESCFPIRFFKPMLDWITNWIRH